MIKEGITDVDRYGNKNPNDRKVTPDFGQPLGRDNALSGQRYYAPVVGELADEQYGRTQESFEKDLNEGLDNKAFSYGSSDPMADALRNQYDSQFASKANLAREINKTDAVMRRADNQETAVGQKTKIYDNEIKNFNDQYKYTVARKALYNQWKAAKEQAESGFLGALLGGIGTVVGGAAGFLVGGPAGAVGGAAVGSKLGG